MSDRSGSFSSGIWMLTGAVGAGAALVALHLLQPERGLVASSLGSYALGRGWGLILLSYLGLALGLASAAVASVRTLEPGRSRSWAAISFAVAAAATAVAGVFPWDGTALPLLPVSAGGRTHLAAGVLALPFYFAGPFAFTLATWQDPRWSGVRWALMTCVVGLAGTVVFLVAAAVPSGLVGAAERGIAAALLAWLLLAGGRIRRLRGRRVEGPAEPAGEPAPETTTVLGLPIGHR